LDRAVVRQRCALPFGKVAETLEWVRRSRAYWGSPLAFKFLVLTTARKVEVCGRASDTVDRASAAWTIPRADGRGWEFIDE